MTPFERWFQDVQALLAWHGVNLNTVSREDVWRMAWRGPGGNATGFTPLK
jgi:hypothetical protein